MSLRPAKGLAHRGASHDAPENTLAAFRRAADERADLVELDVQESSDGVVVVAHDSDLMKVGDSPVKIWEATADELLKAAIKHGEKVTARVIECDFVTGRYRRAIDSAIFMLEHGRPDSALRMLKAMRTLEETRAQRLREREDGQCP